MQDNGNILKTQSTEIPNVPLSQEIGTGGSPRCQEAMGGTIAQTRSKRVPTPSYDSPLLGGNTSGSDDERLEHQDDLIDFVPPTPHDLPLLGGYTPGSDEDCSRSVINKLKIEGQKIGKATKGKNSQEEDSSRWYHQEEEVLDKRIAASASVTTAGISISTAEPRTPPTTTTTAFEDEDLTIAQTLVKMRNIGIMQEPEKPPKNPIKAQIQRDAEIAQRLFEEEKEQFERESKELLCKELQNRKAKRDFNKKEREQFTIEEKSRMLVEMIVKRKRFFAAQRAKRIRNKPPTRAQLKNKMGVRRWMSNDFVPIDSEVVKDSRKGKAEGSRKKTVARKRTGEKLNDESVKRQKIEDDAEKEELKAYLDK
ncbi:hypothetical protein Tco_0369644 [Tanacetum coccineum]